MPSYFDVWKKRMNNNGGSATQSILNDSKKIYALNFKDDPSYKSGILRKSDLTEIPIDTRVINVEKTTSEKRIQILPDNVCSKGDYIIYTDKTYIIEEFENNIVVPFSKAIECNQTLFLKGWDKPIPCFVTNDSYGNKLLLDSDILSMSDEKCKITIQDNQFTRKILKNTRFMFEHSEHGIFKVFSIDVVYQKGLITLICKKDTYKEGIDDLEHNVAGQVDMVEDTMPKDDLVIYGSETIKLGSIEEYTIQSSVAIAWSIDNSSVCTMTEQGKNYCKLKALKRDEVCILTAKINSTIVYQKMITTTR